MKAQNPPLNLNPYESFPILQKSTTFQGYSVTLLSNQSQLLLQY